MANEKKSDFVVRDNRKFTLDGEPRPDAVESEREEQPSKSAAPESSGEPAKAPEGEPAFSKNEAATEPPHIPAGNMPSTGYDAEHARGAFGGEKIEFVHLLELLVQSAMMYAGVLENGPERRVDIVGLRQMIDMIGVLEEKTKGNLTEQEQTLLHNMLFQLRMTYMEIINMIEKQATQGAPGTPGGISEK